MWGKSGGMQLGCEAQTVDCAEDEWWEAAEIIGGVARPLVVIPRRSTGSVEQLGFQLSPLINEVRKSYQKTQRPGLGWRVMNARKAAGADWSLTWCPPRSGPIRPTPGAEGPAERTK